MATGFRTIPSAVAQQAALAQLREIQNPNLALERQIQQAIEMQRIQQQSPENQLALQIKQAQLAALQNPEEAMQRNLIQKFNEELIASSFDPTLGIRRAGTGAPPTGEIEPIINPITLEETPFIRDLSRITKKTSPFQSVGLTTTPEGITQGVVFNPAKGDFEVRQLPAGVTDIRPKVTRPVPGKSILAKNNETGRLTNIVLAPGEALPEGFSEHTKTSIKTSDPLAFSQAVRKDPVVKEFTEIRTQFDRMRNAIEEVKTGGPLTAVDQTLINTFNRILDPESVVREAEYARTAQDQSVYNYLKGKFDPKTGRLALGGAGLTPETREAMIRMAERFYNASQQNYGTAIGEFSKIAQASGLDPELVLPRVTLSEAGVTPRPTTAPPVSIGVVSPVGTVGINPAAPSPVTPASIRQKYGF